MGPPGSSICQENLQRLESLCKFLGVHLAPEKRDGPSPVLIFLGIIVDTLTGELRLPPEKLQRLIDAITTWLVKKACTCRELESLIGTLHHACKVIRPGRSFLRWAISLHSIAKQKHHHIRLNAEFRSDMMWWKIFCYSMEWHSNHYFKRPTRCNDHIRCFGYLGVWSMVQAQMVSAK